MYLYGADEIEKTLQEKITEKEALKAGWEKVTFPKKKDGKEFANMSKNFGGAYYRKNTYSEVEELEIICRENGKYYESAILCHDFKADRDLTFEEIKNKINEKIAEFEKEIVTLRADLDHARNIYTSFKQSMDSLVDGLKQSTGYDYDKELYNMITASIFQREYYG